MNLPSALVKTCNVLYWLALTMWIAALVAAGIAAMNVFGTLPNLDLTFDRFMEMPRETHGRIASGMVMEGVFRTVDVIQCAAAPIAVIALAVQLVSSRNALRRPANLIRTLCIVVAAILFAYHAVMLAPAMNRELHAYWGAAESGQIELAESHLATFNKKHPIANTLLRTNLILLLVAVASS